MVTVYIRSARESRKAAAEEISQQIASKGIHICLFSHGDKAITHSKRLD